LREKGVKETVRRGFLHFGTKRRRREYLARMIPDEETLQKQRKEYFPENVRFSILVPLYNTPEDLLAEMIDSVCDQSYENWELCLADGSDEKHAAVGKYCRARAEKENRIHYRKLEKNEGISGNSNAALEMAGGDYIVLFDHDDVLLPNALYETAKAIHETGADFLYTDEMVFRHPNRKDILGLRFKPGYSPDHLLTNNYICHMTVFRKDLPEKAGGAFRSEFDGSQDHDLILRMTDAAEKVHHIPKILYMWRSVQGSVASDISAKPYTITAGQNAVRAFLRDRKGMDAEVVSTDIYPTMYRVKYPIDGESSVRVIADMRGKDAAGLETLKEKTAWQNIVWTEIAGEGSRRDRWETAAREAKEDYLLFLEGELVPENPDWIREMLMICRQSHVGAVGAKTYVARGNLRQGGIVLGMGVRRLAGRAYYMLDEDYDGYYGQLDVVCDVSAVCDCWMVRREKFGEVDGFSDGYNDALFDIDFCLKLRENGYYNVFTPFAELKGGSAKRVHFDAGSEWKSYPEDAKIFRERWQVMIDDGDPFYNPNLSLDYEDWRIGKAAK